MTYLCVFCNLFPVLALDKAADVEIHDDTVAGGGDGVVECIIEQRRMHLFRGHPI